MKASVVNTHMGNISIDNEVIAQYAGAVAMECFGIVGMANVNERIKMNFGDRYGISIESELGKGTTVSVVIPAILFNYEETNY